MDKTIDCPPEDKDYLSCLASYYFDIKLWSNWFLKVQFVHNIHYVKFFFLFSMNQLGYQVFIDGGSRGNPGESGCGVYDK